MVFEEYYKKYLILKKIKKEINDLENNKISLMSLVGIRSSSASFNPSHSNNIKDKMLIYSSELEQIELNLKIKKEIRNEIVNQLDDIEKDLLNSKEILDKIYYYKYIEKLKYSQICKIIHYEKSSFYNFLETINKKLNEIRKSCLEKNGKKKCYNDIVNL